jgi:hypothetical protein
MIATPAPITGGCYYRSDKKFFILDTVGIH